MPGPRKAAWGSIDLSKGEREGEWQQQDAGSAVLKLAPEHYYPIIWKALRQHQYVWTNIMMIIFLHMHLIFRKLKSLCMRTQMFRSPLKFVLIMLFRCRHHNITQFAH